MERHVVPEAQHAPLRFPSISLLQDNGYLTFLSYTSLW